MEAPCLTVEKQFGRKALALARRLKLLHSKLRTKTVDGTLFIPLLKSPTNAELKEIVEQLENVEIQRADFSTKRGGSETLLNVLQDTLPPHLLASLPRSIDIVGDVAVVEIPEELEKHRAQVGEAVLKVNRKVRTVLGKMSAVSGPYRLREFEAIAGDGETSTIHREFGCSYRLDLMKVYFSPRLSYEHSRIASQAGSGEVVVDLFAGVGPFSILTATRRPNVHVYSVDVNPDAVNFLLCNVVLNRVWGRITPILGDAEAVSRWVLQGMADRVIMNLPAEASKYVEAACRILKPSGGMLHYYTFAAEPGNLEKAEDELRRAVEKAGMQVEHVWHKRSVKPSAPHEWLVAVDAKVSKPQRVT